MTSSVDSTLLHNIDISYINEATKSTVSSICVYVKIYILINIF